MNTIERWFLKRIIKKEVTQGYDHQKNITNLYRMIREEVQEEFIEDNVPTINCVLAECFNETQIPTAWEPAPVVGLETKK